jgi:hypothetical protein
MTLTTATAQADGIGEAPPHVGGGASFAWPHPATEAEGREEAGADPGGVKGLSLWCHPSGGDTGGVMAPNLQVLDCLEFSERR